MNVPAAAAEDAAESMPYMGLCVGLGRLLVQLADDRVDTVVITYGGSVTYFDTRLLTLGVLSGVLAERVEGPVNYVNAQLIADESGVTAAEQRQAGLPDFPRLITVSTVGPGGEVSVSGTSLGPRHKARLVSLFGEDVDIEPAPHMAFLRYVDAPGIGGKLGTLLGEWGVNIAHMSVGRGKLRQRVRDGTHSRRLPRARPGRPARHALRAAVRQGGGAVAGTRRRGRRGAMVAPRRPRRVRRPREGTT